LQEAEFGSSFIREQIGRTLLAEIDRIKDGTPQWNAAKGNHSPKESAPEEAVIAAGDTAVISSGKGSFLTTL
jgi:hypothetical protein